MSAPAPELQTLAGTLCGAPRRAPAPACDLLALAADLLASLLEFLAPSDLYALTRSCRTLRHLCGATGRRLALPACSARVDVPRDIVALPYIEEFLAAPARVDLPSRKALGRRQLWVRAAGEPALAAALVLLAARRAEYRLDATIDARVLGGIPLREFTRAVQRASEDAADPTDVVARRAFRRGVDEDAVAVPPRHDPEHPFPARDITRRVLRAAAQTGGAAALETLVALARSGARVTDAWTLYDGARGGMMAVTHMGHFGVYRAGRRRVLAYTRTHRAAPPDNGAREPWRDGWAYDCYCVLPPVCEDAVEPPSLFDGLFDAAA